MLFNIYAPMEKQKKLWLKKKGRVSRSEIKLPPQEH